MITMASRLVVAVILTFLVFPQIYRLAAQARDIQAELRVAVQEGNSPRIGELLGELEDSALVRDPLSAVSVNVRELHRNYNRLARLPRRLVEELARVTSLAQQAWVAAREKSAFLKRAREGA